MNSISSTCGIRVEPDDLCLGALATLTPIIPGAECFQVAIERLADLLPKSEEGREQNVGQGKSLAGEKGPIPQLPIEPFELVLRARFQAGGGLRWRLE